MCKNKFVLFGLLLATNVAFADEALMLLKKNNCGGCHSINQNLVGPSFEKIATEYDFRMVRKFGASMSKYDTRQEMDRLQTKLRTGDKIRSKVKPASYHVTPVLWCPPAPATMSENDIKTVVRWIAAL